MAFDEQIFVMQREGGISRSFVELVRALNRTPGVRALPPRGPVVNRHAAREWDLALLGSRSSGPLRALRRRRPAAARQADILHSTFYDPAWLPDRHSVPFVVTVHDMIPELFPERVNPAAHLAKREYVHRADLILVNSECTRRDLLGIYGAPAAPVVVTPFGVATDFFADRSDRPALPQPYLVFVGHRGGYKSFGTVVAALPDLPEELHLVAVGGGPWTAMERETHRRMGIAARVHRFDVTDDDALAAVYRGAEAAVVPSEYEGFGLPVLEAMAAGTVVVASRAGALPEVGGDAAVYFTVGDAAALATSVARLMNDRAHRDERMQAGRLRAESFTWARTAHLTAAAYRSVLG